MITRQDLPKLVEIALNASGGSATVVGVAKYIWEHYEDVLRDSDNLFFTWQYDIRWAAYELRKQGIIKDTPDVPKGVWELKTK